MKGELGIGEQKREALMEKAKGMAPGKNITEDVSISVPEADAGSSGKAVSRNMQRESFRHRPNSSTCPSKEIACFNRTSSRSQTNDPLKEWTTRAVSVFEWILVGCSVAGLVVSFIHRHCEEKNDCKFNVSILWKWCVLVLVIVAGRHFMGWMMMRVKDYLAKNFKGNARYSYYIYGLRKSVGVFLWFVLVLLAWYLLLDTSNLLSMWRLEWKSNLDDDILNFIRSNLITLVIVGALWVVKTFLVNKLSFSFQVTRYFDWIRNSLINQHILEVFDQGLKPGHDDDADRETVQKWINELEIGNEDQGVIYRLLKIDPKKASAWIMKGLIDKIRSNNKSSSITKKCSCFSIKRKQGNVHQKEKGITEELENLIEDEEFRAKLEYEDRVPELDAAADRLFSKMKHHRERNFNKDDLIRLYSIKEEEAAAMIQQINGQRLVKQHYDHPSENQINEVSWEALKMWLAHATVERRALVQSINDMKSAVKELNELFSGIVLILLVVIWSLMVGLLTRDGLLLILSQIFFLTFMFGSTAKSAFEGIILVFVKHPFDIGDLCLINKEEMVAERITLLTTVFRKNNKDKVFYSNSALSTLPITVKKKSTLPIGYFYRGNVHTKDSPQDSVELLPKKDSLELTIRWPTALNEEIISSLISCIKQRLCKDKNKKWQFQECDLVVNELEDKKTAKMVLYVSCCNENVHRSGLTMISLRHELIIALNGILTDLEIEHYEIRPREVDHMKNTAEPPILQEPNQQSNYSQCEEPKFESNEETTIKEEEKEKEAEEEEEEGEGDLCRD